jgi:hypothetical protein
MFGVLNARENLHLGLHLSRDAFIHRNFDFPPLFRFFDYSIIELD